ncbi:MAG: hypothetical protein U0575_01860 [Phycisphaerales bacterium]
MSIRTTRDGGALRLAAPANRRAPAAIVAIGVAIGAARCAIAGSGPCWCEDMHGDAGSLPGPTAQATLGSGPLTCIAGRIRSVPLADGPDLEDMFLIRIDQPELFSAQTVVATSPPAPPGAVVQFNTQLWLFDVCGFGLLANDDDPCERQIGFSRMQNFSDDGTHVVVTKPGLYYIALSRFNDDALSQGGLIFDQRSRIEVSGPDGTGGATPIVGWNGTPSPDGVDLWYRIELTGCTFAAPFVCPTDLNSDDVTNGADLGILLANWGGMGVGDLNDDFIVNGADLGLLLSGFGQCPPPAAVCGNPEAGSCFQPHPGAACDDACCCQAVCEIDLFCCSVAWDGMCASGAAMLCPGGPGGPPGAGNCCVAWGGLGCGDPACARAVCDNDPSCCDVVWDAGCADLALINCPAICGSTCPDSRHGCYTVGGPGCDDPACCFAVCSIDPFCCDVAWDLACVNGAIAQCGLPSCPFGCPDCAVPEGEPCGTDTNGGCNSVPPKFRPLACQETVCATAWASGGMRDTDWYQFTLPQPTVVRFTAFTTLPLAIGIVNTGGIADCTLASALDPFVAVDACGTGGFEACLPAGTWWFFAAPAAFAGFPCGSGSNQYWFKMECLGPCDPTCFPACPANGIQQNDGCADQVPDPNGGCNEQPALYQDIGAILHGGSTTVCGTVGTFAPNFRDLDWYRFSLPAPSMVRVTVEQSASGGTPASDFAVYIVKGDDCATQTVSLVQVSGLCPFTTAYVPLPPGNHVVILTVDSFGLDPPACPVQYVATIEAQ